MKTILLLSILFLPLIGQAADSTTEQVTADSLLLTPEEREAAQEGIVDWLNWLVNDILFHPLVVIILGLFGVSFVHPGMRAGAGKAMEATGMKKPKQPNE